MASIVDEYLEGSDNNDDIFSCKGCGEILEEGKAFELAGNRWHIDCFRCNTCGTQLDSDANLLMLGDSSLICNKCTYSCTACGNKIEDLAILTGDQAFCSTCFRCRNCKRKIENLRYARTSQGIFCMQCHETLMVRRRKRSKAAAAARAREKDPSQMVEKSLPALPPNVIPNNAFSNDRVSPGEDSIGEFSPPPRQATQSMADAKTTSRGSSRPAPSPERHDSSLKSEGYKASPLDSRKNRHSSIVSADTSADQDTFFIPVALDPSPGPVEAEYRPRTDSREDPNKKKDYFSMPRASASSDKRPDSHGSTPHIAFQEKGRKHSSDQEVKLPTSKLSKQNDMAKSASSPAAGEGRRSVTLDTPRDSRTKLGDAATVQPSPDRVSTNGLPPPTTNDDFPPRRASHDSRRKEEHDGRESVESGRLGQKSIARKEVPLTAASRSGPPNGRPSTSEQGPTSDAYTEPRSPPVPPARVQSSSEAKEDRLSPKVSPTLPRWSSGADFSLDEDMARILGTDEHSSNLLRRVSHVARHGRTGSVESGVPSSNRASHARSVSETTRATTAAGSPKWAKMVSSDGQHADPSSDMGSPRSVLSGEDSAMLKRQLRNSKQRVAELEKQIHTEEDVKTINKKLMEKRKTVSVLDTQTELLIQQLEVLTKYVERAKDTKTPVDPKELEDSAIREFVLKLEKVKVAMSASIEELHAERTQLMEDKDKAVAERDRALMEFEQLSSKNAQLADMNNDLTHQLQERYKTIKDGKPANGLGIYSQSRTTSGSVANLDTSSINTGTTLIPDEEPIVESGPTVVQVRKGQVKKFNWKKGSKTVAQGISKGMNKAVVAFQNERDRPGGMGPGDIGVPYNTTVTPAETPSTPGGVPQNRMQGDHGRQGFGFFGKKNPAGPMSKSASANMSAVEIPEPPNVLFGSELVARAEFEKRQIPSIVSRCIEEVELRGMDQEGIYRKTGGNSQVTMIKEGLDKDEDFDLSDPDLDITAVTSVLKQYFRKLPTPLLTFEVYEKVLESTSIQDTKERCEHLRKTFSSMPQSHKDCLEFLMFHLDRVASRETENLMSPKNLAVVFAPTIMRDLSIEREMTDMHAKNLGVQFVIENTHSIFNDA